MVRRAEAAGYEALVLTADAPVPGRRERDARSHYVLPPESRLANFSGELVDVRSEPLDRSPFGGFDFCASLREWVVLADGGVAPRGGWINSGQFLYLRLTRAPDEALRERRPFIGLRVCDRKQ